MHSSPWKSIIATTTLLLLPALALTSACGASFRSTDQSDTLADDEQVTAFQMATTVNESIAQERSFPRLVNYFHMNLPDSQVSDLEARLARWDVVILNPDDVKTRGISLEKIRSAHTDILLLAWIPFGQEPDPSMAISKAIPKAEPHTWYAQTTAATPIVPVWGGHLMNPFTADFAWARHVAQFVKSEYLDTGQYDGIMFDILSEWAPTFASSDSPPTFDVNGDGEFNNQDHKDWQAGVVHLLQTLRASNPSAILTGNGGVPWTRECPYMQYANGDMHENALGNEFGSDQWESHLNNPYGIWDGIRAILDDKSASSPFRRIHFLSVDLRMHRDYNAARYASGLTPDDLRRMRLGLCTALMEDNVYFGFDRGDSLHGQLWWFDEYDAPLGNSISAYDQNRFGAGTYSREFENGTVVVNPGSTPVRINLQSPHRDVTTGNSGTTFTIPPMDGRIYISD
ncbi:MAG: hypothetical protein JXR76_03065 [Deltaproteobacteria bacterium]|nr:hypothetical protein [Deltaproteobacteria bacterium]